MLSNDSFEFENYSPHFRITVIMFQAAPVSRTSSYICRAIVGSLGSS